MSLPSGLLIAGVDEAGRGPLVGNVVAAAVILPETYKIPGLTDSKKLTAKHRERIAELIKEQALAFSIAQSTPEQIDSMNILQATLHAMALAIEGLPLKPDTVLVDGRQCPQTSMPCRALVKGDLLEPAISAASILAKVTRDQQMLALHVQFPDYGFDRHKGYPTAEHLTKIKHHGVTPYHRRSFRPVRNVIMQES